MNSWTLWRYIYYNSIDRPRQRSCTALLHAAPGKILVKPPSSSYPYTKRVELLSFSRAPFVCCSVWRTNGTNRTNRVHYTIACQRQTTTCLLQLRSTVPVQRLCTRIVDGSTVCCKEDSAKSLVFEPRRSTEVGKAPSFRHREPVELSLASPTAAALLQGRGEDA